MDENQLLLRLGTMLSQAPSLLQTKAVEKLGALLRSTASTRVFIRLCAEKADTRHVLAEELRIPSRTVYDALKLLKRMGLVEDARPMSWAAKTGPKATIYALTGHGDEPDALRAAVQRDRHAHTPAYAEVKRLTQLLLDDYLVLATGGNIFSQEMHRSKVNDIVRKTAKVRSADVLPLVIDELRNNGYQVV